MRHNGKATGVYFIFFSRFVVSMQRDEHEEMDQWDTGVCEREKIEIEVMRNYVMKVYDALIWERCDVKLFIVWDIYDDDDCM